MSVLPTIPTLVDLPRKYYDNGPNSPTFARFDIAALFAQPGLCETGSADCWLTFWSAVDLVVVMPISWLPLVADYSRFARRSSDAFWGTGVGYFLAHVWFYALGALLALSLAVSDPVDLFLAVGQLSAGAIVLLVILVDETDEGFANIYSTAVSAQNILPRASNRTLSIVVGAVCAVAAVGLIAGGAPLAQYESFLLLIGAFFVPLMGLLAADYFLLRRRAYDITELYQPGGEYWYAGGVSWPAMLAWAIGVVVYLGIAGLPPFGVAGLMPWLGATIPSFIVALLCYLLVGRRATGSVAETARAGG